jgi:hypothetical protein
MSGVDWVFLAKNGVKAGDLVSTEAGGMPIYRIIAVEGGQAWLQGEGPAAVQLMPLDRFHWRASDPDQDSDS